MHGYNVYKDSRLSGKLLFTLTEEIVDGSLLFTLTEEIVDGSKSIARDVCTES